MNNKYTYGNLVLYSYGKCNLNCRYCSIDKNPSLNDLDKLLEDSFLNYNEEYVPRIEKYFPNNSLRTVETWGGEPLTKIERIFPLLDYIITHQSNFKTFFSSTNFSYPDWTDRVLSLINFFSSYSNRRFNINIQLSCDGPIYLNDRNRGKGVTNRCLKNISNLCKYFEYNKLSSNIRITFTIKPTLTIQDVNETFQDKNKIIEYYQFFENNIISKITETQKHNSNIIYMMSWPNLAVPAEVTQEDGLKFANACKLCTEINAESSNYFNYYSETKIFTTSQQDRKKSWSYTMGVENLLCRTCGTGAYALHLLPQNLYSTCYMTFVDMVDSYKKYIKMNPHNKVIQLDNIDMGDHIMSVLNQEEMDKFHTHSCCMCENMDLSICRQKLACIITLAQVGQIDKKYQNKIEAVKALQFMQTMIVHCPHQGNTVCGSMTLFPFDMYKLMLNGALEYYEI